MFTQIKNKTASSSSEWGLGSVVIVLCIMVGYFMFPNEAHSFVQYIMNTVFDALGDNFNTSVEAPNNGSGETGSGQLVVPEYKNIRPY